LGMAGVGLLGGAGAAWVVADRKFEDLSRRCTATQPCSLNVGEGGKGTIRWLERTSAAMAVVGTAALVSGTVFYLRSRGSERSIAYKQIPLIIALQGGAGVGVTGS